MRTSLPRSSSIIAIDFAESRLSSTTSMRRFPRAEADSPDGSAALAETLGSITGSVTVNVLPRPGPGLAALTVPPCILTRPSTRASPMPRPPRDRSGRGSTWENMLEHGVEVLRGEPIPVSRTDTAT